MIMVIGGTIVTTDSIIVEITAEAGKSYLDEMVGLDSKCYKA